MLWGKGLLNLCPFLTEDTKETAAAESIVEEQTYDCVICNQTAPSTSERPFGLVTLFQSTSGVCYGDSNLEPFAPWAFGGTSNTVCISLSCWSCSVRSQKSQYRAQAAAGDRWISA